MSAVSHLNASSLSNESSPLDDSILDDTFHGCAWEAYIELTRTTGEPPVSEATRRLAFAFYEEALAKRRRKA